MNAAHPDRSQRLQRVLALLKKGGEYTTMQIVEDAHVMAVSACVSELRLAGHNIRCQRRGDRWYYRIMR